MFRKNGDRPHFLLLCPHVENVPFLTKWGLSPFFVPIFQKEAFALYDLVLECSLEIKGWAV